MKTIYGIVYKATNKIDGRIYIGQTAQSLHRRRKAHENLSGRSSAYFHRALAKHGIENFSWEVLESCDTKENLHSREIFWITHLGSMAPFGYNSAEGGKGGAYSEAHRKRISEAMKGRVRSEETRRKLSEANKGRVLSAERIAQMKIVELGEKNHFFGKSHTPEAKRKIGEKSKNRNWAKGDKAGSWAKTNRKVILECYFKKQTDAQIIATHFVETGVKISRKAIARVFNELGLHISATRGRRASVERHSFIDSHSIETFYERLKSFT